MWHDGRVYVATMNSSTLDATYLSQRGFHWYGYDVAAKRFIDLSATQPGGTGAVHGGPVTSPRQELCPLIGKRLGQRSTTAFPKRRHHRKPAARDNVGAEHRLPSSASTCRFGQPPETHPLLRIHRAHGGDELNQFGGNDLSFEIAAKRQKSSIASFDDFTASLAASFTIQAASLIGLPASRTAAVANPRPET